MRDKPITKERETPPPCLECKSLHRKHGSPLCPSRRLRYWWLELLRALPLLGRLAPAWECDLRKYETVEDIEKEASY